MFNKHIFKHFLSLDFLLKDLEKKTGGKKYHIPAIVLIFSDLFEIALKEITKDTILMS